MKLNVSFALTVLCLIGASNSFSQGMWENLDGQLGALAKENLEKKRPPAPVDFTGTWNIDMSTWQFQPPKTLLPKYQTMRERALQAKNDGLVFNNDVGQCWPPGVPLMMNRVWPINIIQLPTSIIIISNFENQIRWVYMDGRSHSDPELYVPSYNGESIGHWEGNTLVVETKNYEADHHWITDGIPVSYDFKTIERFSLNDEGTQLSIEYQMTDPNIWKGDWASTKRYQRQSKVDFLEVHCLPNTNDGIITTSDKYRVTE